MFRKFNNNYGQPYPYSSMNNLGQVANKTDWSKIFNNTQKTLNFINSALPLVYQIGPIVKNAGTMMKVYNEFNKSDKPKKKKTAPANVHNDTKRPEPKTTYQEQKSDENYPKFFM